MEELIDLACYMECLVYEGCVKMERGWGAEGWVIKA